MPSPQVIFAEDLRHDWPQTSIKVPFGMKSEGCVLEYWALARPLSGKFIWDRIRLAWAVFTGKYDALKWADKRYVEDRVSIYNTPQMIADKGMNVTYQGKSYLKAVPHAKSKSMSALQERTKVWLIDTFQNPKIAYGKRERTDRFLEEALELVQSVGADKADVLRAVDYVFSRPRGETVQEVGGVSVTLAAFCVGFEIPLEEAAWTEFKRCLDQEMQEKIREKQKTKPLFCLMDY